MIPSLTEGMYSPESIDVKKEKHLINCNPSINTLVVNKNKQKSWKKKKYRPENTNINKIFFMFSPI